LRTNNKYTCILPKVLQFIGPICQDAHVESAHIDEKAPFTDPRKSPYTVWLSAQQSLNFTYYRSCCEARMSRDEWIAHEATSDHVSKSNQARQVLRDERMLWHHRSHARLFMPRVASLSLREHQNDVHLLLFRYVCNTDETLDPVQGVLKNYEFMDRVTMLLLAIWKANCVLQPPYPLHDALDWNEWITKGWKETKQQMLSSKVFLVYSLVVEYLKDGASEVSA
jgi:hypothetical protein